MVGRIRETHCSILLTSRGRGVAVVQGLEDYERAAEELRFVKAVACNDPAEHGRVVPTWNYLAVHAQGAAQIVEDSDWRGRHVRSLTDRHEAAMATPWSVDDAPAEFTERLLGAIVGVEITIESLTGKLKASQNQPERNREGVRRGLESSDGLQEQAMATFLKSTCSADQQPGNHKGVP